MIFQNLLATLHGMWGLISQTRNWTYAPIHWKHGALTPGPLGKSSMITFYQSAFFFLLLDRSMTCGSVKSSVIICFSQQCMQKFLMVMMVTYDAYISYFSVFICGEEFMHLFILLSKFLLKFSSFTMLCKCTSKWFSCTYIYKGFPGGTVVKKKSTCQRRCQRLRFVPWVRKIPWCRKWQPSPVFLPGKFHG